MPIWMVRSGSSTPSSTACRNGPPWWNFAPSNSPLVSQWASMWTRPTGRPAPTHLLRDGVATPLDPAGQALGAARLEPGDDGWHLRGDADAVRINGRPPTADAPLATGDCLQADGAELWLIAVSSGHGPE